MMENLKKWWRYFPPPYATSDKWTEHENEFRENAPIRYFFNETVGNFYCTYIRWPLIDPILKKYRYLKCRILPWKQYNIIRIATLKPTWMDKDEILLHANFQILVDFIEVEKAWMMTLSEDVKVPWYKKPFFRSRELGLKHLEWESQLDQDPNSSSYQQPAWTDGYPSQAEAARQQKRLYLWWKDVYPNREDAYDNYDIDTNELLDIEQRYKDEEQEALQMLMKIRFQLWT